MRLSFIFGAAITLLLGFHYEMDYRDSVSNLPSLVDEHGRVASLDVAIAGMDSYKRAKRIRRLGFVSLGLGTIFCLCVAITKNQRDEARAA